MRSGEAGFSLIESLVALAILAVSAVSLLVATEAHVGRIGGLETRALAQFAAENRLVELEAGLETDDGPVDLLGRSFEVRAARVPTADPDLERVELAVTERDSGASFRGFTGFVGAEASR